jgi:hypothetical protein
LLPFMACTGTVVLNVLVSLLDSILNREKYLWIIGN